MKLIIDIPEGKELRDKAIWCNVSDIDTEDLEIMRIAIANGTPISDNTTNGDLIKALFSNWGIKHIRKMSGMNRYECNIDTINRISFYDDWWNSLYKRGETNE